MRGYVLVDVNIKDSEGFMCYASRISTLIEKHGGRYIIKGEPKVIQGSNTGPQFVVVIEFPSLDVADQFIAERSISGLAEMFNHSADGKIVSIQECC